MEKRSTLGEIAAGKHRFIKNTMFSAASQGTLMLIAVLLLPFMLWRLGAEKYGLWLTLQIFSIGGLISLAELGLQGAIVRYLVKYHTEKNHSAFRRLLVTGFLLFFWIGVICGFGLYLFGRYLFLDVFNVPPPYQEEMRLAFYIYAASMLYGFPMLVLKAFYAGTQNFAMLKLWETGDRLLFSAAVVALLFLTDRILAVVLLEQVIAVVMFLLFFAIGRLRYRSIFSVNLRYASANSLRGVVGMSGLMFLNNASWLIYLKVPDAVIGSMLGPVNLTYYSMVCRIPRALKAFQGAINAAAMPFAAMLDSVEGGDGARKVLALKGMRLSFMLFTPIATIIFVFAEEILHVWVGAAYVFLAHYLRAFMLWQLISFLVAFGGTTFTRSEHYHRLVWKNLGVNALFLLLLVWWIKSYQLTGVLAALMVGGVATMIISLDAIQRANGFSYAEFYKVVVRAPILMAGAVGLMGFGAAKVVLHELGVVAGGAAFIVFSFSYLYILLRFLFEPSERAEIVSLWSALAPSKKVFRAN